jgi:hypothetical protein
MRGGGGIAVQQEQEFDFQVNFNFKLQVTCAARGLNIPPPCVASGKRRYCATGGVACTGRLYDWVSVLPEEMAVLRERQCGDWGRSEASLYYCRIYSLSCSICTGVWHLTHEHVRLTHSRRRQKKLATSPGDCCFVSIVALRAPAVSIWYCSA